MRYKRVPITPRNRSVPPVQTEEFKARQFAPAPDVPKNVKLSKKPICVNLPEEQDAQIRAMEDKSIWLRAAIAAALEKKGGLTLGAIEGEINKLLETIPPKKRIEAAKLFKKLVDRLK